RRGLLLDQDPGGPELAEPGELGQAAGPRSRRGGRPVSAHESARSREEFPAIIGAGLLRRLVTMSDAITASRRAFIAAARGEVTGPLRSSLSRQRVLIMP